jgi:hypothetical protein
MAEHRIVVERRTRKRFPDGKVTAQLKRCATLALKGERGRGWEFTIPKPARAAQVVGEPPTWVYTHAVRFTTTTARESVTRKWPQIVERFARAACAGSLRLMPWTVVEPRGMRASRPGPAAARP